MKNTRISYQKTFPLESFSNERIGIEFDVEDNASIEEAFDIAKQMVNQEHQKNNEERQKQKEQSSATQIGKNETPIESFKRQVDQCKSLTELNGWDLFVSGKGKEEYKKYLETAKLKYK
ncbi:MAG: hypothetical protein B7Y11_13730 [Sphingobacteriia bacterium 24-36-13]|nr:MAG: hypothetical protein B7Y11_13730 [Sphingobacteriia bacterium 24-36-13]